MTRMPEARAIDGWRRIGPGHVPRVHETGTIQLRDLPPGASVRVGFTHVVADDTGSVSLRPTDDESLHGHVGIVDIAVDGVAVGEIELVPHKMSEGAYQVLRADLQRVWTDLVFADDGATSVAAGPPPARDLWRRIDRPLMQILDQPSTRVEVAVEPRHLERVRHHRELTPAVVRAGQRRRPALTRTLRWSTSTPENELCTATLHLLRNHARRDPAASDLVRTIDMMLRHPTLPTTARPIRRITWGMRSDRRYRQVLAVHQVLNRPELEATEGPGELRLGVPALTRLYEYWVFLQVLVAATQRYGLPDGDGFAQLATPVRGNRKRLEIERGTTVTFPGPIHIAFEPNIDTQGDGWMGIEYVPHPDPSRQQFGATPDVAVLDLSAGERSPAMLIIDAKYVGRAFVEHDAARMHEKYARMRLDGIPLVRNVLVAHPHPNLGRQWAGYGHFPLTPGDPSNRVPLPPTRRAAKPPSPPSRTAPPDAAPDRPSATGNVHVLADQFWMREALDGRRIDLAVLRDVVGRGRIVDRFDLVMPRIGQLNAFSYAAEAAGWTIEWIDSIDRRPQRAEFAELVKSRLPNPILVVSDDPELLRMLPPETETFNDLPSVPDL
jgi:hypothetical protein